MTIRKFTEIHTLVKDNPYFDTYWKFAWVRQEIFYAKMCGFDWHIDYGDEELNRIVEIIDKHRFTNVFRASDRVSQYLIRNVIYIEEDIPSSIDTLFRILLFKIFNKIETWELFINQLGGLPSLDNFDFEQYCTWLDPYTRLFNNAYMMTGAKMHGYDRTHWNYMKTFDIMIKDGVLEMVKSARSLESVYELILSYPLLSNFLAMQYTIDLNYSQAVNFDENDFIIPGNGGTRGLARVFRVKKSEAMNRSAELISYLVEVQHENFERLGLKFRNLFGRDLKLIDAQNVCCEVDKLCRALYPDTNAYGITKIKQLYTPKSEPIDYFFPPKWGINHAVESFQKGCRNE